MNNDRTENYGIKTKFKIELYWMMIVFIFAMICCSVLTRVCYDMGSKEARDEVNSLWVAYLESNGIKWRSTEIGR